jgi:bifunctional non-homologous end joining protein LigD
MPVHEKNKPTQKKSSTRIRRAYPISIQAIVSSAPFRPIPREVRPMLATLTDKAFDDQDWLFEVKWDGYRAIEIGRAHV